MYPEPKDEEPHGEKGRPNNHLRRPKAVDANSKHLRRESSVVNKVGMYPEPKDEEPHMEKGRPNNHLQRPKAVDANREGL